MPCLMPPSHKHAYHFDDSVIPMMSFCNVGYHFSRQLSLIFTGFLGCAITPRQHRHGGCVSVSRRIIRSGEMLCPMLIAPG
jgi:hypothetical protein